MTNAMTISQIRNTIESCNWNRQDLGGATAEEFKRCNVPARLGRHIDAVRALVITPRFARDIKGKAWAIECAEKTIARWEAVQ